MTPASIVNYICSGMLVIRSTVEVLKNLRYLWNQTIYSEPRILISQKKLLLVTLPNICNFLPEH